MPSQSGDKMATSQHNQVASRLLVRARLAAGHTQETFAPLLEREIGVPITKGALAGWEVPRRQVPAGVVLAAAKLARRTIDELVGEEADILAGFLSVYAVQRGIDVRLGPGQAGAAAKTDPLEAILDAGLAGIQKRVSVALKRSMDDAAYEAWREGMLADGVDPDTFEPIGDRRPKRSAPKKGPITGHPRQGVSRSKIDKAAS